MEEQERNVSGFVNSKSLIEVMDIFAAYLSHIWRIELL